MPTTFIGRDNNNNPCYHVRKGNGLSVADMKAEVQDDTLFHSSLPYLHVVAIASTGVTGSFTRTGTQHVNEDYYVFNIPQSIKNLLQSNYTCICIATWSNGGRSLIDITPHVTTWKRRINSAIGRAISTIPFPIANSSGWWALNYIPSNSGLGVGGGLLDGGQYLAEAYTDVNGSLDSNSASFLNRDSQCLVFQFGNGAVPYNMNFNQAEYATAPIPSAVEFYVMNSTVNTNLNFQGFGASSGDIRITRDGLYIGGSNVLSGAVFVTTSELNVGAGSGITNGSFSGELKLGTLALPYNTPPFSYRHKASYDSKDNTTANTAGGVTPVVLAANGGIISQYKYYRLGNYYTNTSSANLPGYQNFITYVDSSLGYYATDTFILKSIPSNVNSCMFSKDSLYVNGLEFFNANTSFIRGSSGPAGIDIPAYNYTGSTAGIHEEVLNTFAVKTPNTNLIMFYNVNKFTLNPLTGYDNITGGTVTLYPTARQYVDNLGMKLVCLSNGQYCHLITFSDIYESTSGTNSVIVTYCFRRIDNTVQLIRHVTITDNQGTSSLNIPGFRVNYMQLASAF